MENKSLRDFAGAMGQARAAQALGVTQGAVSQMLLRGRDIYITVDPAGEPRDAYEMRRIGKFRASNA